MPSLKLFGMPASLYTAKARSYLRKQALPIEEHSVSSAEYQTVVQPAIQRMIMPVLTTDTGDIIQDSADIIRFCENQYSTPHPALPESAILRSISYLFELFGGEGLLRPAMHYRWNFDDSNLDFLRSEFRCLAPADMNEDYWPPVFEHASGRMRKAALAFGVNEQSAPIIEASYDEFLQLFNAHIKDYPYLLGGRPTLGDYALMGPLYAHLYRDPKPGMLMRQKAPRVARWVERMNTAETCWTDYAAVSDELVDESNLPDTLLALMRFIGVDYMPEILAHVDYANQWLRERPNLPAHSSGFDKASKRDIGAVEFEWRDITINTSVMPYRFYLLQYLQDSFDEATEEARESIETLFTDCGIHAMLSARTKRRVIRKQHLEVWE